MEVSFSLKLSVLFWVSSKNVVGLKNLFLEAKNLQQEIRNQSYFIIRMCNRFLSLGEGLRATSFERTK